MTIGSHVEELKKKHQALSDQVEQIQRAPGSSDLEIAELKKQKLRIKEEISRLSLAAE
ncbi:MAG: YdcH family protein [Paracoccaceae bacterium]